DAEGRSVVRLRLHSFFLLRASRFKSSVRACLVFGHARQQSFPKAAAQNNRGFAPTRIVAQRNQPAFGRSRIAFSQRTLEPRIRTRSNGGRSLREDGVNRLVERSSISFPEEFKLSSRGAGFDIVGHNAERAIKRNDRIAITPQELMTKRDLL